MTEGERTTTTRATVSPNAESTSDVSERKSSLPVEGGVGVVVAKSQNPTPSSSVASSPMTTQSTIVQRARYPLTSGLSNVLYKATSDSDNVVRTIYKDSPTQALTNIVQNCITALDTWYFTVDPIERQAIQAHRTCLRVSTTRNESAGSISSITITDLGVGMTRADLINLLGVGKYHRSYATQQKINKKEDKSHHLRHIMSSSTMSSLATSNTLELSLEDEDGSEDKTENGSDYVDDDEEGDDDDGDDDDEEEVEQPDQELLEKEEQEEEKKVNEEMMDGQNSQNQDNLDAEHLQENSSSVIISSPQQQQEEHETIYCHAKDVGGFYAAICALAVGVKVGTKSKFDEYYEFELGKTPTTTTIAPNHSNTTNSYTTSSLWKEFTIVRPMKEGQVPSLKTGYHGLADVRGSSGTSVTLYLQPQFQEWTTPEGIRDILLPMMTKILETTPYTFVVDGIVSPEESRALLQASEQEDQLIQKALKEKENNVAMEDNTDVEAMYNVDSNTIQAHQSQAMQQNAKTRKTVLERSKYIPLRLSLGERKLLRLVEAAMNCCDYTTVVDDVSNIHTAKSQARRIHNQLKGVLSLLRGLVTACDYAAGQKLARAAQNGVAATSSCSSYNKYLPSLRKILEIARRHKIMNPEKMRTEYGKLVYLLQDAVRLEQEGLLEYGEEDDGNEVEAASSDLDRRHSASLVAPILTVYSFLQERGGLALLRDKNIEIATEEILATPGKTRTIIDQQIRRKERAVAQIKKQYQSSTLSMDDIHLCLYSICDNNSFLNSNRVPIDKVIEFLKTNFSPSKQAPTGTSNDYSLAIVQGEHGARLSHSHERQYYFALQSLTLWRDIIDDMFRLWAMAEHDLLNPSITYNLQDTGQGMQRVQQSPQTYKAMQVILTEVQRTVRQWVGSSVIHLGDHNVPNALAFIDKYTQVPRILGPIVTCLENVEKLVETDDAIRDMINNGFGGLEQLQLDIMYDFFRSAFDGSGADNFYDAGSCIDGRMTSAWNWCSHLPNKQFYPIFKLTGFIGFDGEFK